MEVILIRHTSVDVPPDTCYGQTDVPLKDTFKEEASATLAHLQEMGPVDRAFTSPLTRAVRLAEFCGYPDAVRDKRLMEINFGKWEMKSFGSIMDQRLEEWYKDYLKVRATEGESFLDQVERVRSFLEDLKKESYERVAVFAHGGILISAQVITGKISLDEGIFSHVTPFGGIVSVTI